MKNISFLVGGSDGAGCCFDIVVASGGWCYFWVGAMMDQLQELREEGIVLREEGLRWESACKRRESVCERESCKRERRESACEGGNKRARGNQLREGIVQKGDEGISVRRRE